MGTRIMQVWMERQFGKYSPQASGTSRLSMRPQKRSRKLRQVWVRIGALLPESVTAQASSRYLSFISGNS